MPTIFNDLARFAETHAANVSSFRLLIGGGSAVPRSLIERLQALGVRMVQIWGMTEISPLAAYSHPPWNCTAEEDIDWRAKTGCVITGVDLRIVHAGKELPWDGQAIGEIEVRGPWVTAKYYKDEAPEKFDDGWLKTGDVGSVDPLGFIQITDRAKDVIKSGGEWVSSVELENQLMAHPDVLEAAVIAVADERWDERPLACVVLKEGTKTTLADLRAFLSERVARWWLPERWAILDGSAENQRRQIRQEDAAATPGGRRFERGRGEMIGEPSSVRSRVKGRNPAADAARLAQPVKCAVLRLFWLAGCRAGRAS